MTGRDIQQYEYCIEKAKANGFYIQATQDSIKLYEKETSLLFGAFEELSLLLNYICGYKAGFSKGIYKGAEMQKKHDLKRGLNDTLETN